MKRLISNRAVAPQGNQAFAPLSEHPCSQCGSHKDRATFPFLRSSCDPTLRLEFGPDGIRFLPRLVLERCESRLGRCDARLPNFSLDCWVVMQPEGDYERPQCEPLEQQRPKSDRKCREQQHAALGKALRQRQRRRDRDKAPRARPSNDQPCSPAWARSVASGGGAPLYTPMNPQRGGECPEQPHSNYRAEHGCAEPGPAAELARLCGRYDRPEFESNQQERQYVQHQNGGLPHCIGRDPK